MSTQLPFKNPYQEFTYVIPAKANGINVQRIFYDTTYFRVLALTKNTLNVNFGGQGQTTNWSGAGLGVRLGAAIPWIELTNTGADDLTITVALGHVPEIVDSRFITVGGILAITPTPGATLVDATDIAVLAGATTKVISSNTNAKSVAISNLSANLTSIRVGTSAAGATRGIEVPNGACFSIDCSGDLYVYNPSAGTINIGVLSVRT